MNDHVIEEMADAIASELHVPNEDVLRILHELPDIITIACNERAPHKITTWVRELAGAFHGFYHDCRIMGTDTDGNPVSDATTQARLWLVESARIGLVIGLGILGVSAPESM